MDFVSCFLFLTFSLIHTKMRKHCQKFNSILSKCIRLEGRRFQLWISWILSLIGGIPQINEGWNSPWSTVFMVMKNFNRKDICFQCSVNVDTTARVAFVCICIHSEQSLQYLPVEHWWCWTQICSVLMGYITVQIVAGVWYVGVFSDSQPSRFQSKMVGFSNVSAKRLDSLWGCLRFLTMSICMLFCQHGFTLHKSPLLNYQNLF